MNGSVVVQPEREPGLGSVAWRAWLAYTQRASAYQTQVILSLAYYLILGPSIIIARLFGTRLLDLNPQARRSYWLERRPMERTVEALERQF